MKNIRSGLLPLASVALTILALWYSQLPPAPAESSVEQVREEAQRGQYRLVSTDELWGWYQNQADGIFLVDTRQDWEYRAGHIKGAVSFPMTPTWWARWRERGALEKLLGHDKDRTIVFY